MKENDIRPKALLNRYFELSKKDVERFFGDEKRFSIPCVACGSMDATFEFEKYGFAYSSCKFCRTLFQNPRSCPDAFEGFYRDSNSSNFWAEVFFPQVAEIRREKIFSSTRRKVGGNMQIYGY